MGQRSVTAFTVVTGGDVAFDEWKVLDVSIGIDGNYSETAVAAPAAVIEEWDEEFDPDDRLYVKRGDVVVMKGRILKPMIEWGMHAEGVSGLLLGTEWDLDRAHVWGQRANNSSGSAATFTGLDAVFNPDGVPNKVVGSRLFEPDLTADGSDRELWTVKEMVLYLLERFAADVESGLIDHAGITWPTGIDAHYVFGVKVQGQTYREALTTVLSRAGYSWALKAKDDLTAEHDFLVFRRGVATGVTAKDVYLPLHGATLSAISDTNRKKAVPEGLLNLDHAGVITQLVGFGGVKVYESTFALRKGWSPTDEATVFSGADTAAKVGAFRRLSTKDNDSWTSFMNVGRRYILNETGREETNPVSTAWDFSTLFGAAHTDRPRPFLAHRMSKDSEGNFLPPQVLVDDVVYGGGSGSVEGEYTWRLLEEIAGIFFDGAKVPYDAAKAIKSDDYQAGFPTAVKIIAAVESDQAISDAHTPAQSDLTTTVVRVLDLQTKFVWDNINGDTAELKAYVEQKGDQLGRRQDVGRLLVHEVVDGFYPGDWIGTILQRAVTIHAQVVGIRWDVEDQVTEIFLESMDADATADRPARPSAPPAVSAPSHTKAGIAPTKEQIEAYNEYMRRRGISVR